MKTPTLTLTATLALTLTLNLTLTLTPAVALRVLLWTRRAMVKFWGENTTALWLAETQEPGWCPLQPNCTVEAKGRHLTEP